MNIFFLHSNPKIAAQDYCDKHCSKMILEIAQQFCANFWLQNIPAPYKLTHQNHPSTVWSRLSSANFEWLIEHAIELCAEKTKRFGRSHKSEEVIEWVVDNYSRLEFPRSDLTKFAIAISENSICRQDKRFNEDDPVLCYRLYYKLDKFNIATWNYSKCPEWWDLPV